MQKCYVSSIDLKLFENLKSLDTLDISVNKISTIGRETFKDLQNLEILDIHSNSLFENNVFADLGKLKRLHLHYNN